MPAKIPVTPTILGHSLWHVFIRGHGPLLRLFFALTNY